MVIDYFYEESGEKYDDCNSNGEKIHIKSWVHDKYGEYGRMGEYDYYISSDFLTGSGVTVRNSESTSIMCFEERHLSSLGVVNRSQRIVLNGNEEHKISVPGGNIGLLRTYRIELRDGKILRK